MDILCKCGGTFKYINLRPHSIIRAGMWCYVCSGCGNRRTARDIEEQKYRIRLKKWKKKQKEN
jgi:hypothetical protein